MRNFANDTLIDVLYFMSPQHHDLLIEIITKEMNVVVETFRNLTGYTGEIAIMGHSLCAIITWDILNNQKLSGVNHTPVGSNSSTVVVAEQESNSLINGDDDAKSHQNAATSIIEENDNNTALVVESTEKKSNVDEDNNTTHPK